MKILLIEDTLFWQKNIQNILEEINFPFATIVSTIDDAKNYLLNHQPDLIISDIYIQKEYVFDLFVSLNIINIPTIFITSSDDFDLYERKPMLSKSIYMVKPIQPLSLKSAIEILLPQEIQRELHSSKSIVVKGRYNEKISLYVSDIIYIRADKNYCILKTNKVQFMIRSSLSKLHEEVGDDFIKVHRAHIINKNKIVEINMRKDLIITPIGEIPIGISYKHTLISLVKQKYEIR